MIETLGPAAVIFVLRCVDVSLGTLRMILTIQGRRNLSAAIGFVEVSIFITAVASVVGGPLDPLRIVAYGGGFAAGTWLGVTIDRRLALGDVVVRVISRHHAPMLKAMTAAGFGVTLVDARGGRGTEVGVLFSVSHRRRMPELLGLIRRIDRSAIVTVQDLRTQYLGYFTPKRPGLAAVRPVAERS